jgi:cell division protein FtsW (lipid II flippase)
MRTHSRLSYYEGQADLKRKQNAWLIMSFVLAALAALFGFWTDKAGWATWHLFAWIVLLVPLFVSVERVSHYAERIES